MQISTKITSRRMIQKFTLIEMLMVIAIIGILVSMLMPGLHSSLNTARKTSCANNMRQITIWGNVYADDWNGVIPHNGGEWIGPFNGYAHISSTRWPNKYKLYYGTDTNVLHCPQTTADLDTGGYYGLNCYRGGCYRQNATNGVIKIKRQRDLTPTAYWFGDAGAEKSGSGWSFGLMIWPNSWSGHGLKYHGPYSWTHTTFEGHNAADGNGSNFIYGDGHLETHASSFYYALMTTAEKRIFNGGYY